MAKKTFFVTTAIDYPNSKPHIGHAYEKIVSDVQARWHRLLGEETFFLTGTDEHGQKIQRAAEAAGKQPQEFVDAQVVFFKELCERLNISIDKFIRTSDAAHMKVCEELFKGSNKKGDIYTGTYEGLYCTSCENYYTEKELANGCCPVHNKPVEVMKEETYFFRLSKYQKQIVEHIQKNPSFIQPEGKRQEILNRLKEPLRDLSVSRTSFNWGILVPLNPKHVIYVWFDALINYYSATRAKGKEKFWPANVHNIGKDILWFHGVIWPAILLSNKTKLPKQIFVHGFINTASGEKMSKSAGDVIDPFILLEKYSADSMRYFLLREIPMGYDGFFSEELLAKRHNNELANELGNLVNRTLVMLEKYSDAKIPKAKTDKALAKQLDKKKIMAQMENFEFNNVLSEIFSFAGACNKFINDKAPWKDENKKARTAVLYSLADSIRIISILVSAFLPATSAKINEQFGFKAGLLKDAEFNKTKAGTKIKRGEVLFKKIE